MVWLLFPLRSHTASSLHFALTLLLFDVSLKLCMCACVCHPGTCLPCRSNRTFRLDVWPATTPARRWWSPTLSSVSFRLLIGRAKRERGRHDSSLRTELIIKHCRAARRLQLIIVALPWKPFSAMSWRHGEDSFYNHIAHTHADRKYTECVSLPATSERQSDWFKLRICDGHD